MSDYLNDIERYHKGEMTPAEMHALEKRALSDPFLAEALEGAAQLSGAEFSEDVKSLNKKITTRRKPATTWTWTMRIAAGLVILIVATFFIWRTSLSILKHEQLTLEKTEPKPERTESADSIATETLSQPATASETGGPVTRDQQTSTSSKSKVVKPDPIEVQEELKEGEVQPPPITTTERPAEETKPLAETQKIAEAAPQSKKTADLARSDSNDELKSESAGAGVKEMAGVIRGKVTSAEDGTALPGVNVIIKGTSTGTVTNAQGEYQLNVFQNPTLIFSFIGLQALEVNAEDRQQIDVKLSPDATQLSEVVVTGYGIENPTPSYSPTVNLAHPETGDLEFKRYLESKMRYPQEALDKKTEGRVTVEFFVETDGRVTGLTVIRGIGSGCDDELIRLIKEGPKWVPTKKDAVPVRDKARVRLKFELPKK